MVLHSVSLAFKYSPHVSDGSFVSSQSSAPLTRIFTPLFRWSASFGSGTNDMSAVHTHPSMPLPWNRGFCFLQMQPITCHRSKSVLLASLAAPLLVTYFIDVDGLCLKYTLGIPTWSTTSFGRRRLAALATRAGMFIESTFLPVYG